MANTYTLISSVTVGAGGASSIDFTSIPATYTDLALKISGRNTSTNQTVSIEFNGDTTAANYKHREIYGNGSAAASTNGTDQYGGGYLSASGDTANTFGTSDTYIPNYAGSNYKSFSVDSVEENNATAALATLTASLWSSTSAITSIKVKMYGGNFAQYSTAYLYGIKNS